MPPFQVQRSERTAATLSLPLFVRQPEDSPIAVVADGLAGSEGPRKSARVADNCPQHI